MNFKDMVKQAIAEGYSPEEIVEEFTSTMNELDGSDCGECEIDWEAAEYVMDCDDVLDKDIKTGDIDYHTAASAAVVAVADTHPEATLDELKSVYESVAMSLNMMDNVIGKSKEEIFNEVIDELTSMFKQEKETKNKFPSRREASFFDVLKALF